MNKATLCLLEYQKIIGMLEGLTVSNMGRNIVGELRPETDIGIIDHRLMETSESRSLLDKGASVPLSALEGIEKVIEMLGKVTAMLPEDFSVLRNVLAGSARIKRYMKDRMELAPNVASYAASMYELDDMFSEIDRCILDNRVDDQATTELARTRKRISIVEDRIAGKLESILRSPAYRDMIQDAVVSMRGGSYVIPVKREHKRSVDGSILDVSSSGSTVFIEPTAIRTLKNELNMLKIEEEKEVYKVLSLLTSMAEGYRREILVNVQTMAHYDFLFAKAKLANQMKASCPLMNTEKRITIFNGRHPLICGNVVPLDFNIGGDYRALVITGPNTGGKTVVLKTVGLFCAMAQSGLHVPADEGTELSVFRDILADIGDGQSIEQSLSTFSAHIRNIIGIVECAGSDTLVIIDELGTGTDPAEGMGLAIAVMEDLFRKGSILLATTHYSEIKDFAKNTPGFKNGCMLFDTNTLMPLYSLSIGIPGESNAFLISLRLGMNPEIISRAHEVTYGEKRVYQTAATLPAGADGSLMVINSEIVAHAEKSIEEIKHRDETRKKVQKLKVESRFKLGDCVFVTSMNRTGIVCDEENPRGEVGVMIMKKRFTINKKRLRPFLDGKDLYPEDYDLAIVLESKEDRKKHKLMSRKYVKGLVIESPGDVSLNGKN